MSASRAGVPSYDELYSISDLHLGGARPGGQIFCHGGRLKSFLQQLAGKPGPLCLVVAGDLFDTLPYLTGSGTYVAIDSAVDVVQTIMGEPAFAPVFEGLKAFLRGDGRELVLLIGNHDLEIALPEVQEAVLDVIAPTAAARGRVRFSTSGVGFRCQVGDQTVYVTHGNEADPWNHVDHEALRKAAHARALGQPWDARRWVPNAGTKLVIDAMNAVKATHPFIDLLKPETGVALKVLRILAPSALGSAADALPAFMQGLWAQTGPAFVLGADAPTIARERQTMTLLREAARASLSGGSAAPSGETLLDRVGEWQTRGLLPGDLVSDDQARLGYLWKRLTGASVSQALREVLKEWVEGDRTFALEERDETYRAIVAEVGPGVDVVITGHTHLPRWITARDRGLTYLNAGAWARTMGIHPKSLKDEEAFAPVRRALQSADMRDLDTALISVDGKDVPLLLDATAAAHVAANGRIAELVRIRAGGSDLTEDPVDRTQSVLSWR